MGAVPIAMAQDQAYHAISTRVVDGGEWQIPTIYSLRLYEVTSHISLSRHFLLMVSLISGTRWFDTLSPLQQTQLRETTQQTFKDNQAIVIEYEGRFLDQMRARGVTVEENPDRRAFQQATAHLYSDMETTGGVNFERLRTELFRQLGIN
jgi:TRAP-type C4-dicarboxylate transport system substrate-binding protein